MTLPLSALESQLLADALDAYLPQLEQEASRIDRTRDAHPIWDRCRALQSIRMRLTESKTPPLLPG